MGGKSTEFKKFVFLQLLSELNVVEVVEAINGIAQCLVVFLLNEKFVIGDVDGFDIELQRSLVNIYNITGAICLRVGRR